jgi:hypothetical protein
MNRLWSVYMLGTQKGSGLITDPLPASTGNEFIIWKMAKIMSIG